MRLLLKGDNPEALPLDMYQLVSTLEFGRGRLAEAPRGDR